MTRVPTASGALSRALLAATVLAVAPLAASAQFTTVRHPGELEWTPAGAWRQGQGLPHDRVISLHQARDGYLWVGTRVFTTLTAADGLVDDLVRVVAVDGRGTAWAGTDRGLSRRRSAHGSDGRGRAQVAARRARGRHAARPEPRCPRAYPEAAQDAEDQAR
jgi:hypothetical protein